MKAYVITVKGNEVSETASQRCIKSHKQYNNFPITVFDAIVPEDVDSLMREHKLTWNYPWNDIVKDFKSGLTKTAYQTNNKKARIACALSHYTLWLMTAVLKEPILILEHDSLFIKTLDPEYLIKTKKQIIGINNPLYATRMAGYYLEQIKKSKADESGVCFIPTIDDISVPQGLAGNSAYIIKPAGARQMIELVDEYGLWPNDAIMCKQLVKGLGVTKTFYTEVQKTKSTTTL